MSEYSENDIFGPPGADTGSPGAEDALAAQAPLPVVVAPVIIPVAPVVVAPVVVVPEPVVAPEPVASASELHEAVVASATDGAAELNEDGNLAAAPDVIYTYTGGMIRPLAPRAQDVNIVDIAHALSNQCRFTGHTKKFYSVAEHCVLVSRLVRETNPELALTGLLHDASEAYLADLARPIKQAPDLGETYRKYETALEVVIAEAFHLVYPFPEVIKDADNALLAAEIALLMPTVLAEVWPVPPGVRPTIRCWEPGRAEIEFLTEWHNATAAR